jgi:large repetitive protein
MCARFIVFIFLLGFESTVVAQTLSEHNWYFGNSNLALRFNRADNSATLITGKVPLGIGGSAVATDASTANLLFYTDGVTVYDATNQAMSGVLLGDPARNQGVTVCKVPGQDQQYYIFHADAAGTIRMSHVDMSLVGNAGTFGQPPLGDLVSVNNATPIPANQSEAMIIVPHDNGQDFWLITHTLNTNNYNITSIATGGITFFGTTSTGLIQNAANFAYHKATGQISVAPREALRNIEILTFDNSASPTIASRPLVGSSAAVAEVQIYDTEWSNSGQYLYASVKGNNGAPNGDVLQFDVTDETLAGVSILPAGVLNSFGIQLAPDSAIYHLYEASAGVFQLGKLTDIDTVAAETNYNPRAFGGNPDFDGRQFPSFAPKSIVPMTVNFTFTGTCTNAPTTFFPDVVPGADSLRWNFGDGQRSNEWSPIHVYQSGGTSPVAATLTAFLNGDSVVSAPQTIPLTEFDLQINLVQDTTACSCELPFPKNPNPPTPPSTNPCSRFTLEAQINGTGTATWQWFGPAGPMNSGSGQTATLQPDSLGFYYLVATIGSCSTYAGVNINEYGVQDQRANIWYFGKNAGIDFNTYLNSPPPPQPIENPVMIAPEGTSTMSDRNGQVLFFTDGSTVWDREFNVVVTGLGGDLNSTQSVLIIPVPGDETLYYIFTTQAIYPQPPSQYELRYTLYDVKSKTTVGPSQVLFTKSTERITGNDGWLIAHEYGNNSFRAYRLTPQGISNPVISSIGSDHLFSVEEHGEGYMKLGGRNMLAVALSTPGVSNVVELFDFVDSTGMVTNFRTANLNSTTGQVYGVEFSPGGNKLFATLSSPGASQLFEFMIDSIGAVYMKKPPLPPVNEELGAIETAPTGEIYVAVNNRKFLGTIQVNEDTTARSNFTVNGFSSSLPNWESRLGLPNFSQNISNAAQAPSLTISGFCRGDSTLFAGSGTDPIDTLTYKFGDGTFEKGANLTEVSHLYNAAGTYFVELIITNRCRGHVETLYDTIVINEPPPPLLPLAQLCQPPQVLDPYVNLVPPPPATYSYLWPDIGATTRTISISRPGSYPVTVTDNLTGCITSGEILVVPSLTTIDLGADENICSTPTSTTTLSTGINNTTNHVWTLNGAVIAGNTTGDQTVDLSVPGSFTYIATYFDNPADPAACFTKDTITFNVNPTPVINSFTGNGPIICNTPNGILNADITLTGGTLAYTITGGTTGFALTRNNQASGAQAPVNGLLADTYLLQASDQLSGCPASASVVISSNDFTVTPTSKAICEDDEIDISTSTTGTGNYSITNSGTGQVVNGTVTDVAAFSTSQKFPVGNYSVSVTVGGCLVGGSVTLSQGPQIAVTFNTANLCNATPQLTAVGGTSFVWDPVPGILSDPTSATVTIAPGIHTLRVVASDGGVSCPTPATTTVTVDTFTPDFTFTDGCTTNQVTLTATQPVGNYFYRWFNGATQIGSGSSTLVTTSGDYVLQVQNPATGCPFVSSPPQTVGVEGPLTVFIQPGAVPCIGATALELEAVTNRPADTFEWRFNNNVVSGATSNIFTQNLGEGIYSVTAITAACSVSDDFDEQFARPTQGSLPNTAIVCPDPENADPETKEVTLYPGFFISYLWSDNTTDTALVATQPGEYTVTLENELGCFSVDRTTVIENCVPRITGPNAFRPGGLNKEFFLFTRYIQDRDFQVFIFNRWGEMVYQSNQREFRWNGGYNNNASQILPPGTYSYVVKYRSIYDEEDTQEHRGGVVLLR